MTPPNPYLEKAKEIAKDAYLHNSGSSLNPSIVAMCRDSLETAIEKALQQTAEEKDKTIKFCKDIAEEELPYAKVGTGAEVALRHIVRKCSESLNSKGKP